MEKFLILFILVSRALTDSCVTYTFEEDYNSLFTSHTGVCSGFSQWDIGRFEDTDLKYDEQSTLFIFPQEELSCVKSFMFPLAPGGLIEVNIYMETTVDSDLVQVMLMEYVQDGFDVFVGQAINSPAQDTYVAGWHTLTVTVFGYNENMTGYISIWGKSTATSTVLVDSFRYIPPGIDECELYPTVPTLPTESTTAKDSTTAPTTIITSEATAEPSTDSTKPQTTTIIPEITTEPSTDSTTAHTTITTSETTIKPATDSTTAQTTTISSESTAEQSTGSTTDHTTIKTSEKTDDPSIDSSTATAESTIKTTTVITETTTSMIQTTDFPTTLPVPDDSSGSFWTPLRLKILVVVSALILLLITISAIRRCCCNPRVSVVVVRS